MAERLEQLRAVLTDAGAQGVLLRTRRDFAWLTLGGANHVVLASETGAAPLLVTAREAAVLAPVNEAARISAEEVSGLPVEVRSVSWWEDAGPAAAAMTPGRLVGEDDLARPLEALRTALGAAEHARLQWLGALVADSVESALASVTRGQSEESVAADVSAAVARHGARAAVLLAAADDRINRFRHPLPTALPIGRRLMVVAVIERWGLHAAYTRFRELEAPDADIVRRRESLAGVLDAMREATAVGRSLGDVLDAARSAYAARGMDDEWALHHQGGSIGYAPRERIAVPGDKTPIRAGMAFAWNPAAVGYKLEETLYLDADGRQHVVATSAVNRS